MQEDPSSTEAPEIEHVEAAAAPGGTEDQNAGVEAAVGAATDSSSEVDSPGTNFVSFWQT